MRGRRGRRLSVLARRSGAARGFALTAGVVGFALFMIAPAFTSFAQEKPAPAASPCLACHGPAAKRPLRAPLAAAHADVDCADCHVGAADCPNPKPKAAVACAECHADVVKASGAAGHDAKMTKWLAARGRNAETAACAACHGPDTHAMRAAKDPESPTHPARVADACMTCHREVQPVEIERFADSVHGAGLRKPNVKTAPQQSAPARAAGQPRREREASSFGGAACPDCHGSHAIDHSSLPASRVFRGRIAETCGGCHPEARDAYVMSVHAAAAARGFREAPICTDCHGEHGIRARQDPASRVAAGNVTKTCAACHALEALTTKFRLPADRVSSFQESYHGLSGRFGDVRVAHCASCHGNHAIFPSADPRSSIHPANLARTCGTCHPGTERRFIAERIHSARAIPSHWTVGLARAFYVLLIAAVIGGMLAHNGLDLICKCVRGAPAEREAADGPLLTRHERLQHGLLAASFVLLAVSGFAIAFPESPLAWPFRWFDSGAEFRRRVHRIAGFALLGVGAWHGLYVLVSARGRELFRRLAPRVRDLRDAGGVLIRLFRPFTTPLRLPVFSYVEKTEYWALVWGTAVMGATGLLLFWHDALLAAFPVWVTDLVTTVHFWEALLACLAILVWHGYAVVFDPEVYPMNPAWLIGRRRAARKT